MNKHRMREPFHTLIWKASIGYNDSWSQVDPEVLEKFAELIVKECVNLMENQKEHYYSKVLGQQSAEHYDRVISKGDAFDEAVTIIRSHFRS